MPTPLPSDADTNLHPPDAPEVELLARGIATAITPPGGLSDHQYATARARVEAEGRRFDAHGAQPNERLGAPDGPSSDESGSE